MLFHDNIFECTQNHNADDFLQSSSRLRSRASVRSTVSRFHSRREQFTITIHLRSGRFLMGLCMLLTSKQSVCALPGGSGCSIACEHRMRSRGVPKKNGDVPCFETQTGAGPVYCVSFDNFLGTPFQGAGYAPLPPTLQRFNALLQATHRRNTKHASAAKILMVQLRQKQLPWATTLKSFPMVSTVQLYKRRTCYALLWVVTQGEAWQWCLTVRVDWTGGCTFLAGSLRFFFWDVEISGPVHCAAEARGGTQ